MTSRFENSDINPFSQKFMDFLRGEDFPQVLFMNAYGYTNALRSGQYDNLIDKFLRDKF